MKKRLIIIAVFFCISASSQRTINYSLEIYLLEKIFPKIADGIPGEFTIRDEEIPVLPFITDDEIESFDTSSYKIKFNKDAAKKMGNLKPGLQIGIPFVLCVDRHPVLTGYICNSVSSFGCNAYALINFPNSTQVLMKGIPELQYARSISERRKSYFFVQALKRTGRLK